MASSTPLTSEVSRYGSHESPSHTLMMFPLAVSIQRSPVVGLLGAVAETVDLLPATPTDRSPETNGVDWKVA